MSQSIGRLGEQLAVHFLVQKGYVIRARNYWTRYGEIDIVAEHKETIIFVEVKAKTNVVHGEPFESATPQKLEKVMKACRLYVASYQLNDMFIRIDVIAIVLNIELHTANIKHFKNVTA